MSLINIHQGQIDVKIIRSVFQKYVNYKQEHIFHSLYPDYIFSR
jgi:hypothetical protein